MSTLRVNTLATAAGVEVYTAKAWVNFNGTGTVAIRASGNVSSITDNGTGDYTLNFTTAMVDANYSLGYLIKPTTAQSSESNVRTANMKFNVSPTASACRFVTCTNGGLEDYEIVSLQVFR